MSRGKAWKSEKKRKKREKRKGLSWEQKMYLQRKGRKNRHHILAKARGGTYASENIIWMDERRHSAFHLLFGLKTFREAAEVLIRAADLKEHTNTLQERRIEWAEQGLYPSTV